MTEEKATPMSDVDKEFKDRVAWARANCEKVWDLFEKKMTEATFTKKEIEKEGKVVRNFMGSVESHKKIFLAAVEEFFEGK